MREEIGVQLRSIEKDHQCRVLFAAESGSRAWGFASPDSDYDVRFIYAHPSAWHFRLEPRRDTIELMTPDDLDLSGWELGKALRLFAGCNLPLNEWLDSPDIYEADAAFHEELRNLIPDFFNPRKSCHHYLSTARNITEAEPAGEGIRIKKLFYILRPLLACTWIMDRLSMPPTSFSALLSQPLSKSVTDEISALLRLKAEAAEAERTSVPPAIADWIAAAQERAQRQAPLLPAAPDRNWSPLNRLMERWTPALL